MKALTLTQPYASLVAVGAKQFETRSWPTKYRGPLAIHAAKTFQGIGGRLAFDRLILSEPFWTTIQQRLGSIGPARIPDIPTGGIVAVAELADCTTTEGALLRFNIDETDEQAFGDYSHGRYAWLIKNVRPLAQPIPCRGALGLWNVPPDVLAVIEAAAPGATGAASPDPSPSEERNPSDAWQPT